MSTSKQNARQRLIERIQQSKMQYDNELDKYLKAEAKQQLNDDTNWKTLIINAKELRNELHIDRLNSVRKAKAIKRLESELQNKIKECDQLKKQIANNENELGQLAASMDGICSEKKKEIRQQKLSELDLTIRSEFMN